MIFNPGSNSDFLIHNQNLELVMVVNMNRLISAKQKSEEGAITDFKIPSTTLKSGDDSQSSAKGTLHNALYTFLSAVGFGLIVAFFIFFMLPVEFENPFEIYTISIVCMILAGLICALALAPNIVINPTSKIRIISYFLTGVLLMALIIILAFFGQDPDFHKDWVLLRIIVLTILTGVSVFLIALTVSIQSEN